MATKVGSLLIDVGANVARIAGDMGKVAGHVDKGMARVKAAATTARRAFEGLIGAIVVQRIVAYGQAQLAAADQTAKMAQQAGITAEAFQELAYAADLGGASQDQLSTGLKILAQRMSEAQRGSKEATRTFADMGVKIHDATTGRLKPVSQMMAELADRFKGMVDGPKKTAAAVELFGRSGAALIPTLNGGAAGLKGMADEARSLGLILSNRASKEAERYNDNLTRMNRLAQAAGRTIAGDFAVAFNVLADGILKARREGDDWANALANGFFRLREEATGAISAEDNWETSIGKRMRSANLELQQRLNLVRAIIANERQSFETGFGKRSISTDPEQDPRVKELRRLLSNLRRELNQFNAAIANPSGDLFGGAMGLLEAGVVKQKRQIEEMYALARSNSREVIRIINVPTAKGSAALDPFGLGVALRHMEIIKREAMEMAQVQAEFNRRTGEEREQFIADQNQALIDEYESALDRARSITDAWAAHGADAIADFARTGKLEFRGMANSIISDMIRMAAQQAFAPLFGQLFGGALGLNTFTGSTALGQAAAPVMHASGAILSGPTMVAPGHMAGEAGPEAILPLVRRNGSLGVKGGATQVSVQVIDQRSAGNPVEVSQTQGPDGATVLRFLIRDEVGGQLRRGDHDAALRDRFGLKGLGARR